MTGAVPVPARIPPERPLVIAHRGASAARAEHTLAAYELALEAGADGLECDVRLTRDGHLVCIHDRTVNRTSNGTGAVSALELEHLQRLDFASWDEPDATGTVLTVQSLMELVRDAGRPVRLLLETKHPTRSGPRVERELVRLLTQFGWTGESDHPVTVMSFADTAIRRVRRLAPGVPTVLLMEAKLGLRRSAMLPTGVPIAGPSLEMLGNDPGFVERAHLLGNRVYVWTVDEPEDVSRMVRLGVDAIITNRPAEVLAALETRRD